MRAKFSDAYTLLFKEKRVCWLGMKSHPLSSQGNLVGCYWVVDNPETYTCNRPSRYDLVVIDNEKWRVKAGEIVFEDGAVIFDDKTDFSETD